MLKKLCEDGTPIKHCINLESLIKIPSQEEFKQEHAKNAIILKLIKYGLNIWTARLMKSLKSGH